MGEVEKTKVFRKGEKEISAAQKRLLLAELAPSLLMKRDMLKAVENAQGAQADKVKEIIRLVQGVNKMIANPQFGTLDESLAKRNFELLRIEYKKIARAWGAKKERLLEEAAKLLADAMTAKDVNVRLHLLHQLSVHNMSILNFLHDFLSRGQAAVANLRTAEYLFQDLYDRSVM